MTVEGKFTLYLTVVALVSYSSTLRTSAEWGRLCFACLSVCLFVCLSLCHILKKLWTDFDKIFCSGEQWRSQWGSPGPPPFLRDPANFFIEILEETVST